MPISNFTVPKEFNKGIGRRVQMCGTDPFNRALYQKEILRKVREEYVPSGCDGIYFQAFTEVPKCECSDCGKKTKGQLMLEFVNPIVDAIKKEFPDLWISCGIHRNLGSYAELKDLDPRCNIYWENCDSGTSIRSEDEDFGYIYKKISYIHGFSATCPADPAYTEASLGKLMSATAKKYDLGSALADHVAMIDLGDIVSIREFSSSYFHSINADIFRPERVIYFISQDGRDYSVAGEVKATLPLNNGVAQRASFKIDGLDLDARFIKVQAVNVGTIPEWHKGKGKKAWLFVDELMVNPL